MTVTRNAIIKIVTVIAIFTLVKHRDDVWIYAFIMAFGMLFSQLYLWFQLHKFVSFKKPQWASIKRNIQPILLLFVPAIAYSIYKLLDKVMLGAMTSMAQVGMFDNAEKIINIPASLITAFGTVMMPRITTLLASSDNEKISYLNRISIRYFTLLVVGAAFGLAGISGVLAPVYFGQEFADSSVLIAGIQLDFCHMGKCNKNAVSYPSAAGSSICYFNLNWSSSKSCSQLGPNTKICRYWCNDWYHCCRIHGILCPIIVCSSAVSHDAVHRSDIMAFPYRCCNVFRRF